MPERDAYAEKIAAHIRALEGDFRRAVEREPGSLDRVLITEILNALHALRAEIEHLKKAQ